MSNKYRDENGHWTNKENDKGPCYHSSVMSNEDTNYERMLAYNKDTCIQKANEIAGRLKNENAYGTFDFNGNEIIDRYNENGYQISIFRDEIHDVLSEDEINDAVKTVIDYLDYLDYPDIGFFGGKPEISHYSNNRKKVLKVAQLFNQAEYLSWKRTDSKDKYVIGDNAISNPYFDKNKKLTREDYLKAIKELKNEK